jgi:hypothetical protein
MGGLQRLNTQQQLYSTSTFINKKYPKDVPLSSYGKRLDKRPKLFHLVETSRKNIGTFIA